MNDNLPTYPEEKEAFMFNAGFIAGACVATTFSAIVAAVIWWINK